MNTPALHDVRTADPSPREAAMTSATRLITNLLRCVLYLIKHGVYVTGFVGCKTAAGDDRVTVTVAPSPYLYKLFASECCWQKRRQEGALVIFTWFAVRYGIHIEWEEVCAFPH